MPWSPGKSTGDAGEVMEDTGESREGQWKCGEGDGKCQGVQERAGVMPRR